MRTEDKLSLIPTRKDPRLKSIGVYVKESGIWNLFKIVSPIQVDFMTISIKEMSLLIKYLNSALPDTLGDREQRWKTSGRCSLSTFA